jgi:RNA polymerase sigma-70 factor (ECF subfamily)
MNPLEKELIEKAKSGDIKSFEKLVKRYKDKIYSIAGYICLGAPSETDDVYQETFITAFKKIKKFNGNSKFSTWLYRIAANNCWMKFRKRKKESLVSLDDIKNISDHQDHLKKELSREVLKALEQLPLNYRMAVTLVDMENMSMNEAANVLKISVGALKSRLFRARKLLRNIMS